MAEWMVGVDTGGTFTDLVAFEPGAGELRTIKVPSVPADPSTAVINALDELFRGGVAPQRDRRRWCTARRSPPTRCSNPPACAPGC